MAALACSVVLLTGCAQPGASINPPTSPSSGDAAPAAQEAIGSYTVFPSFSVPIEKGMARLDDIIAEVAKDGGLVAKVNTCEAGGLPVEECLDSELQKLTAADETLVWQRGACNPDEQFMTALVEQYHACKQSEQDCICDIRISNRAGRTGALKERAIILENSPTPGLPAGNEDTAGDEDEENEIVEGEQDSVLAALKSIPPTAMTGLGEVSQEIHDEEQVMLTIPAGVQEKTFLFAKLDEEMYYLKDGKRGTLPACKIQQRTFKFCVEAALQKPISDKHGQPAESIQYKFALLIPDIIPPMLVRNIMVRDAPVAENAVLLAWDKSAESDISHVEIFSAPSGSGIFDKETKAIRQELQPIIASPSEAIVMDDGLLLQQPCVYNIQEKACLFQTTSGERVPLEKGKLYRIRGGSGSGATEQYLFILDGIPDRQQYDFSILAVDIFGNEITNRRDDAGGESQMLPVKVGTPIDDLPPGLVTILVVEKTETGPADSIKKELAIQWLLPQENVDGSPADDLASFEIKYERGSAAVRMMVKKEDACDGSFCRTALADQGSGTLRIAALDDKGNVYPTWEEEAPAWVVE